MAHHKSAKKRIRQSGRRRLRNREYLSSVRTTVKRFQAAVENGDKPEILSGLFVSAQTMLGKAGQKGLLHRNNAARRISRLANLLTTATKNQAADRGTTGKKKTAKKKVTTKAKKKKTTKAKAKSKVKKKKTTKKKKR